MVGAIVMKYMRYLFLGSLVVILLSQAHSYGNYDYDGGENYTDYTTEDYTSGHVTSDGNENALGTVEITATVGDSVTMPCKSEYSGELSFVWKKAGSSAIFADKVRIISDERFQLVNDTSLRIEGVLPSDTGRYSCHIISTSETVKTFKLQVTSLPPTSILECPKKTPGWMDLGGEVCYYIVKYGEVTWMDAVYKCFKEGGSLASFHSSEETERILRYFKHNTEQKRLQIGLWKRNDGSFEWVDKSPYDFRNWDRREPSDRDEICVEFYTENGHWNDIYCTSEIGYICSSPKNLPSPPSGLTKVCPHSSSKWEDFGGENCYIIERNDKTTWDDAWYRCHQEGGSLATFHDVVEISVLVQHTKKYYERLHIGLRQNEDGNFEWVDKSPMDFEFWDSGEPSDYEEKCGEIYQRSGKFNDIPCSKTNGYICSTPKVVPGAPVTEAEINVNSVETCGGEIVAESGNLQSPNYPEDYDSNRNCSWKIVVPESYQVALHIHVLELEYGAGCEYDYVEVFDGHDPESSAFRKLCGSEVPHTFVSTENTLVVKFVSDEKLQDIGFFADFTKVERCGGYIDAEEGLIQTRNYPENYWADDACTWKISVPDDYYVHLHFKSFEVEKSDLFCEYDYVQIFDGHDEESASLGKFCGSSIPEDIISPGHKVTVKFQSDYSKEYYGFLAEFKTTNVTDTTPTPQVITELPQQHCGGVIAANKGFLLSPNFPKEYESSMSCIWKIVVPPGDGILFSFKTFELESESDCDYDYVKIYDGPDTSSSVLGEFCGSRIPNDITSSGNEMTVEFHSDSSGEYPGFSATFTTGNAMPSTETAEEILSEDHCGENIVSGEGSFQTPNFPSFYKPHERCTWRITAPKSHIIILKFLSFKVENHAQCRFDYVDVRDGQSELSPALAKLCGKGVEQEIRSTRNQMTITFRSDSSVQYSGFSAEFKTELLAVPVEEVKVTEPVACGEFITAESGIIESPNYPGPYAPQQTCTWYITVPEDKQIILFFNKVELEHGNYDCQFDYIRILDGHDANSTVLRKFCNSDFQGIRSSTNQMTIEFVTDDSIEMTGFSANFSTGRPCSGGSFLSDAGAILSPNFPRNYGPLELCEWKLTVPEDYRILFTFDKFELQESYDCEKDYVLFLDGHEKSSSHLGRYCGTDMPDKIRSTGNEMTVIFRSDASVEAAGFGGGYIKDRCGENIIAESGSFTTPDYPEYYPNSETCMWKITVPRDNQVLLEFSSFELESSDNCQYDVVEIRDGHEEDSPLLGRFCGNGIPDKVHSSTNKMTVKFVSDSSDRRNGFSATFSKASDGGQGSLLESALDEIQELMQKDKLLIPKVQIRPERKKSLLEKLRSELGGGKFRRA